MKLNESAGLYKSYPSTMNEAKNEIVNPLINHSGLLSITSLAVADGWGWQVALFSCATAGLICMEEGKGC